MANNSYKSQTSLTREKIALIFAFCVCMITFLSFISMSLAVACFIVGSVAALITQERSQRILWQQAMDFKLKHMNDRHASLSDEIAGVREDIKNVEANMKQAARRKAVSYKEIARNKTTAKPIIPVSNDIRPSSYHEEKPYLRPLRAVKAQMTKPIPTSFERVLPDDGSGLSDMVVSELLGHAVNNKRVDVFLQPIVRLPQRQCKFYEAFARVRAKPGVYVPAGRYQKLAMRDGVMNDIDALLLATCLNTIKQTEARETAPPYFLNITSGTIRNGAFMNNLLLFLAKNRGLAARLIFEIQHQDFIDMDLPELKIISGIGKLGCRFSIDHVQSLDIDVPDLQRFNVRFVKVPAQMLLDARASGREQAQMWKYKRLLEGNGIGLIVEKVENEKMMREITDFDPHYGQGFLFGRPDVQGLYEPEFQRKAKIA